MRFDGLDLNLLVALDALLSERNVSRAAERIHLSQSAASAALNRLRDYFGDDLLVSQGRGMVLTPRAESLIEPVRSVLHQIRARIAIRPEFDPASSRRRFQIAASDYAITALLGRALARMPEMAPGLSFDIVTPGDAALKALERGELDLLITLEQFLLPEHPSELLFEDDYVVVSWNENPDTHAGVDERLYFRLPQVTVRFSANSAPAFDEWFIKAAKNTRRIDISAPTFGSVPAFLVGSRRISTMHRRLAEHFARSLPLTIHPVPFEIPKVRQMAQWHRFSEQDDGVRWLVDQMRRAAG